MQENYLIDHTWFHKSEIWLGILFRDVLVVVEVVAGTHRLHRDGNPVAK